MPYHLRFLPPMNKLEPTLFISWKIITALIVHEEEPCVGSGCSYHIFKKIPNMTSAHFSSSAISHNNYMIVSLLASGSEAKTVWVCTESADPCTTQSVKVVETTGSYKEKFVGDNDMAPSSLDTPASKNCSFTISTKNTILELLPPIQLSSLQISLSDQSEVTSAERVYRKGCQDNT